jgi:hypothetical protein
VNLFLPYGADTCKDGLVWRGAAAGDHIRVTPGERQQARDDNARAAERRARS